MTRKTKFNVSRMSSTFLREVFWSDMAKEGSVEIPPVIKGFKKEGIFNLFWLSGIFTTLRGVYNFVVTHAPRPQVSDHCWNLKIWKFQA